MKSNRTVIWRDIRPHNGTQYGGFEELCTQLARSERPDDHKAKFRRLGDPDGGIECYWEDSEGNKWGWQAKYYLEDIRWGDITKSIKTALKEHPTLTRYYVCIPKNQTLKMDENWKDHVTEWKALAKSKTNREVEFIWWGDSELSDKLIQPEHAGRLLYWFDERIFSDEWFKDKIDIHTDLAGPRYTAKLEPELHVDLPITNKFEMLGRTRGYINKIKTHTEGIEDGKLSIDPNPNNDDINFEFNTDELEKSLETVLEHLEKLTVEPVECPTFQELFEAVSSAATDIDEYLNYLSDLEDEYGKKLRKRQRQRINHRSENPFETLYSDVSGVADALQEILDKIGDVQDKRLMIISGEAGSGKTHLLCDVAEKRAEDGLPTVLLMGHRFTSTDEPWSQAREHLDLPRVSKEEFVGALEAAAQAKGHRALLMIDAVNEGQGRTIWPVHLEGFFHYIEKSPWIATVLSVRSTYKNVIIPEKIQELAVLVEHKGFEGKEYEAVRTFFPYYKLELPSTPILNPEFRNPLFLKILCKGLWGKGEKRMPRGIQGISEIFNLYLDDVNKRLSLRLDCNPNRNYIWSALRKFAQCMIDEDKRWLDLETAEKVVNDLLPQREYEKSLYRGLVSEDLLIEEILGKGHNIVRISYDRFADYLIADTLLKKRLAPNELETAFIEDGNLASLFDKKQGALEGLIEALSIQVPERTGKELIELVPPLAEREDARVAFLQSFVWRDLNTFSSATEDTLNKLIELGNNGELMLDTLLTIATVPKHKYNAHYLYKLLSSYTMAERDAWWSIYLHDTYKLKGAVNRILDWTIWIPPDMKLEKDVVELASVTLAWMLTSSNRFIRDRATKALVTLLTKRFEILQSILKRFVDINSKEFEYINDPYVAERLYAVAYGVVMRSHDVERVGEVAQWVYDNVFADSKPPVHIMLRDYARGVVERALYLGSEINVDKELIKPPYNSVFPSIPTDDEIKELTADWKPTSRGKREIEWARNRIGKSTMSGDFAFYILGTYMGANSNQWLSQSSDGTYRSLELKMLQKYILKRVFDMDWTIERFGEFDTNKTKTDYWYRRSHDNERIGKKYQWVAYHEIMAYLSDHYHYRTEKGKIGLYEGAWQGRFRDIDPSVILRSNKGGTDWYWHRHKPSWWEQETCVAWKENQLCDTGFEHSDKIPGIEKLLLVCDPQSVHWLNLYGRFVWGQSSSSHMKRRTLWLSFTSCFVHSGEVDTFVNWVNGLVPTRTTRIEILKPRRVPNLFFGEYVWSPAFRSYRGWDKGYTEPLNECPIDVRMTSLEFPYVHGKFDCSASDSSKTMSLGSYFYMSLPRFELFVPHSDLIDELKLKWMGSNADFVDIEGKRAAFDPTANEKGPDSLMFRKDLMMRYLEDNKLTLCWLISGEEDITHTDNENDKFKVRSQNIYGVYVLKDQGPQGVLNFFDPPKIVKKRLQTH